MTLYIIVSFSINFPFLNVSSFIKGKIDSILSSDSYLFPGIPKCLLLFSIIFTIKYVSDKIYVNLS